MEQKLQKLMPYFIQFSNLKIIKALKNGFIRTVPFTLIGSVFLLIANIPIDGYDVFMAGIFGEAWTDPLYKVVGASFDILAIFAAFSLAYEYCKDEGLDGVPAGLFGISGLFIMTANNVTSATGEVISGAVPVAWLGGKGLIAAIVASLLSGIIYSWFIKRDIRIKLPESVPPAVANSFSALIPGCVILLVYAILHVIATSTLGLTVTETIYHWLQVPLQNLTDSLPGIIIVALLVSTFWWCGIHGDAIVTTGIMSPILNSNMLENQAVIDAGGTLVAGETAKIVTEQFLLFIKMGGAGCTMGLILCMVFFSKSKQMKQLGKLGFGPSMFNINEPIIFGTPIIFNPVMFIPFILVPVANATIAYFMIYSGIVPPFTGLNVPWTLPPVLSGLILGGWRTAALQLALIGLSFAIYFPFFKVHDKMLLQQEIEFDAQNGSEESN